MERSTRLIKDCVTKHKLSETNPKELLEENKKTIAISPWWMKLDIHQYFNLHSEFTTQEWAEIK